MKAFDYSDSFGRKLNIRNTSFYAREKDIAWRYVNSHQKEKTMGICPICGKEDPKYLFQRWDVNYYICENCSSVFVPVKDDVIEGYLALREMKGLRASKEYQDDASARRNDIWEDMVRWLTYRVFRYTGKKEKLTIIDYADRFQGQVDALRNSTLCGRFLLVDSILEESESIECSEQADLLLYLNQLQHEKSPKETLEYLRKLIKNDGLIVLSTRLGSGFDILTLKGGLDNIYPYEHIMLPSKEGLEILLQECDFELLEFLTPGVLDIKYVIENKERIEDSNLFVKELIKTGDESVLMEFQRLLQKAGMSSFAQIVARKKKR